MKTTTGFKCMVNYDLSLREMIAAGNYNSVHKDISADNFHINGKGITETSFEIWGFNQYCSAYDDLAPYDRSVRSAMLVSMCCSGLRGANIAEGLAFGAAFPEKQRESPIFILGAVTESGDRPFFFLKGSRRFLDLHWDVWSFYVRFLMVRK